MLKDMSDHKISDDELIPQIMCLPKAVSEIFSTPSNQLKMQCSFRRFFFFFAFTYLITGRFDVHITQMQKKL